MSESEARRRRWQPAALAVAWYLGVLALVPLGRGIVDFFRSRGLLVVGTTVGMALAVAALLGLGWWLRRRGLVAARVWLIAFGLSVLVVATVQLLPRAEERWHVIQYGVLGFLCWYALPPGPRRVALAAAIAAGAGWFDEGIQHLLPDRVYDWWDVGLNAGAGLVGAFLPAVSLRLGEGGGEAS